MKHYFAKTLLVGCMFTTLCACSSKPTERLVGGDRDSHGCIASAGYRWSEVLKDCIRIWEVGERIDNGDKKVYVVFAKDSAKAEIYTDNGRCIISKRKADRRWISKKGDGYVSIENGTITVHVDNTFFVKKL